MLLNGKDFCFENKRKERNACLEQLGRVIKTANKTI